MPQHLPQGRRLLPDRLFAPFEIALQEFYLSGGTRVSSIRAPWAVYLEFLRAFPEANVRPVYIGTPVEFIRTQAAISICGQSATGEQFEFTAQPEWLPAASASGTAK